MGVYQSQTPPKVEKMTFRLSVMPQYLELLSGKPKERREFLKEIQKRNGVPVRVQPTETSSDLGTVFRWDWFQVTTD